MRKNKVKEVGDLLYTMERAGLVDQCSIDESGEFCYKITDKGIQVLKHGFTDDVLEQLEDLDGRSI
jgi:VCBS repeat-containing protein